MIEDIDGALVRGNFLDVSKEQRKKLLEAHRCDSYSKDPNSFWETCDPEFAHLTNDKWRPDREGILEGHRRRLSFFDDSISFKDATVIDYGIGDGLLGYVLLDEYEAGHYVGIDISKRTLDVARKTLSDFSDKRISLQQTPVEFSNYDADVFISAACIQHFPNKEYLDEFLSNLNKAAIPAVMLYIRNGSEERFEPEHPALSCVTNSEAIMSRLSGYKLKYESDTAVNGYQYLILSNV